MKYPETMSRSVLRAFSSSSSFVASDQQCLLLDENEGQKGIRVSFSGEFKFVETLQEICLKCIARSFEENPRTITLESVSNRNYFLSELNAGNDLLVVSEFVKDDLFWRSEYEKLYGPRCCATAPGKWIQVFMEMHLREWLEKLRPTEYDEEGAMERLHLYAPYVENLTMTDFLPPPKHEIHHIPLNVIVQCLGKLQTIDLSVNIKNAGDDFSDSCSNLSNKDIDALASGLGSSKILREFKLSGTKITPQMAKRIGQSLEKCPLRVLHIVNCSLGDQGVIAFLIGLSPESLKDIEELNLTNNFISSTGAFQLAIVLARRSLKHLNLRLNPIKSDGACLLIGKMFSLSILTSINFSACSLDSSIGVILCKMLKECRSLISINLSVNKFNDQLGWMVLEQLKDNDTLVELDFRNTNLSATITMLMDKKILGNMIMDSKI